MDGVQNKKVIIEAFEYKREYEKKTTADGTTYLDGDNYQLKFRTPLDPCFYNFQIA